MKTLVKKNNGTPTVNSFFDDFVTKDIFDWNEKDFYELGSTMPSVNLKETDNHFKIELAVPGMKKDDFKIEIDNNTLYISSEKKEEKEETNKKENYTRKEFNYQSFCRSFYLPDAAETDKVEATYKDGILHVDVAKKENNDKKKVKNIAIK